MRSTAERLWTCHRILWRGRGLASRVYFGAFVFAATAVALRLLSEVLA